MIKPRAFYGIFVIILMGGLVSASLIGCSPDAREDPSSGGTEGDPTPDATPDGLLPDPDPRDWPIRTINRDGPEGLEVRLSFPEPAGEDALEAAVRHWVRDHMVSFDMTGEGQAATAEAAADSFQHRYAAFRDDVPEAPGSWFLHRRVEVETVTSHWVTLSVEESVHTGGAHPSYWRGWANFNPADGRRLDLEALILPGARTQLMEELEEAVRRKLDLAPEAPLTRGGLFENTLTEPGTFALEPEGIRFLWNPYEIGPWSMGLLEVHLDWQILRPLMQDPALSEVARPHPDRRPTRVEPPERRSGPRA